MHFCVSYRPDSYVKSRLFLSYGAWCKCAGVSFEVGRHWREELPQLYLNSADTQRNTSLTHPVWYPPGNMELAFVDSSCLDWVGFLRRRVPKVDSLLQHQDPAR